VLNTAKFFYRLMGRISSIPIPLDTGDFRLMDRRVIEALKAMPERDRFVRGMVSWVGFRQTSVRYSRAARQAGESKYSTLKMLRFAVDGILSFSNVPLHVATFSGLAAISLGVLVAIATIAGSMLGKPWLTGWMCVLIAVFFMGGVQLLSLGMVGEYLWRIYGESKRRPLYLVREMLGFEQDSPEAAKAMAARGRN
jgi:dolichol-phosphate mannosyltransferase